jgi:hypothetical protein
MEFKELQEKLKALHAEYMEFSESDRNSEEGKKCLEMLQSCDSQMKELERSVGIHYGPTGNYNPTFR